MSQPAKFWDKIATKYSKTPISDEAAYQRKLEITRQYLTQEMNVMEFGCGTGSTALAHAAHVKHILATDISANMLEIARSKAKAAEIANVDFVQTSLDDLEAQTGTFDVIMGHSVLHLLEDRHAALTRVYDLLKPGGVFISSTACLGDRLGFLKFLLPITRFLGIFPLVRVFTEAQLIQSLSKAGFEIEQQWRPEKAIAVFVVASKPDTAAS